MRTAVYITVDTESSMGGAWKDPARRPLPAARRIFGRTARGEYGIPLLVQELERHGMKGTFFVETLCVPTVGEEEVRSVTDYLLEHAQDVQLHAHPTFRHYREHLRRLASGDEDPDPRTCDRFSQHEEDEQDEMIAEAASALRRLTGERPRVFRAGGYAADRRTLRVLARRGILIDSSWNPLYRFSNGSFSAEPPATNLPQRIGKVLEMPITVAAVGSAARLKHADVSVLSFEEMAQIVDQAHASGMRHVVTILHCFSTVKARDVGYSEIRPNDVVIRRYRRFLRYLATNSDRFEVRTLGDLARHPGDADRPQPAVIPNLGILRPAARKLVQAVNNAYWV